MNKPEFIYMFIEAVIFLSAFAIIFIKLGGEKKVIEEVDERTKGLPEWKAATDTKMNQLEQNDVQQNKTLNSINDNLIKISTQVQLLLDNRIKTGD